MGQLMFFYSEVSSLDSVDRAKLRDSTYDHTVWAVVNGDLDELREVCEKWEMPYAIVDDRGERTDVEIGRQPTDDEEGFDGVA